ncbi:MAG: hypothetical protein QNJ44_01690 [Rhodobacter sp.]|nr:hypothetical protein [Rhodobacter sp.]
MLRQLPKAVAALGGAGLAACAPSGPEPVAQSEFSPAYKGIETRLLDGDLVNFLVTMDGARGNADVADYAECAAAQYALIRGYGFARHVRTNVSQEGGVWRGDAVYTISPALPRGLKTIDAEVTVSNCAETGIPTV